jgi:hypothetical protein
MSAKSIEEMREELTAAGYSIIHDENNWEVFADVSTPDKWMCSYRTDAGGTEDEADENLALVFGLAIEKAWQHYQREKQFEAMQQLLEERIKQMDSYSSKSMLGEEHAWLDKAKALLESMKTEVK